MPATNLQQFMDMTLKEYEGRAVVIASVGADDTPLNVKSIASDRDPLCEVAARKSLVTMGVV